MKSKVLYWIKGWVWNGYEYEPQNIFQSEDPDEARRAFDGTHLHLDMPAIELYKSSLETDDGIWWQTAEMEFIDRRDY